LKFNSRATGTYIEARNAYPPVWRFFFFFEKQISTEFIKFREVPVTTLPYLYNFPIIPSYSIFKIREREIWGGLLRDGEEEIEIWSFAYEFDADRRHAGTFFVCCSGG
jgi:hypothetical protein